jgi:ankyrin repeat protein
LFLSTFLIAQSDKPPSYPAFDYDVARAHEIKPHRRSIPTEGVLPGFNQLHLTLTVSPTGDVVDAGANADAETLKFWPELQAEVRQWKFTPFEENGTPVTAHVEEYIDLVPPERLPTIHMPAPVLRPDSKVTITLERTGCYGACPSYTVTVSTEGILFDGRGFVVAAGKHVDRVNADEVRNLARSFVAADFYSMDSKYAATVTDCSTYVLSISIDGQQKDVVDYVGPWVGMPAVVSDLEDDVDTLAQTGRWVEGSDGLVEALQQEKFNFQSFDAQVMLKEAAGRGKATTVREFLEAGVPLEPLPALKTLEPYIALYFKNLGWLNSAGERPDVLRILIAAGASEHDQKDKDSALARAAKSGNVEGARQLIAYGANPKTDLHKLWVTDNGADMRTRSHGDGSVLIFAAESGNPEMVREILRYHPNLEARDSEGETAMFAAGNYRDSDKVGARVECVRILAEAGAKVNARDDYGNTPLHVIFLTDVDEELLKLGADVNARNNNGETPIFTTVDDAAIPLFIEHGADLTVRNKKGQSVLEAAGNRGSAIEQALREAIQKSNQQNRH